MCKYKMLEMNDYGHVMRCGGCGQIRVAFGNVLLKFNETKFWEFKNMIAGYADFKKYELAREVKNIYIESPCTNVSLVFSVADIENTNALLEEASLSLQVNQLLET